jgi:hypothetical protein
LSILSGVWLGRGWKVYRIDHLGERLHTSKAVWFSDGLQFIAV